MTHDFVIIGAGSAGAVLASRLSEDPAVSVLLLEAGAHWGGVWSRIPLGVGKILNDPKRVWHLKTEPAPSSNNVPRDWVSGKCLGGSSAVNGLIFVRGHPSCYDEWARLAGAGWGYADCLPYFQRLEQWDGPDASSRGRQGPIGIQFADREPISDRFLEACQALGYRRIEDYNSDPGIGASYLQLSARNGLRSDTAQAYLKPALRRANLTLHAGAQVERIVIDNGRARAVVFSANGRQHEVAARHEIIVCAGAVRSPQLLELSGIGRPDVVEAQGIRTIVANPHVGEHLQDHIMVRFCFSTSRPDTVNAMLASPARTVREVLRFASNRTGHFASASLKSTLYAASDPARTTPDLRIQVALVSAKDRIPKSIRAGLDAGSAFQIGVYGLYPKSSGHVHVRSPLASEAPTVQPNYLAHLDDQRTLLAGMKVARRLAETSPLKDIILQEIRPGPDCTSDDHLLDYARRTGQTCWHPVSTCRMGAPGDAVVDARCRVYGVAGLRVIDASVFPLMTSSNTNIPVIMLAEKAADLIRADWSKTS